MSNNISYKQQLTQEIWNFLPFLDGEKLSVNTPLADYGASPLDIASMLIKMEEKHNIKFNLGGLTTDNITLLNIAKMLKARQTGQPAIQRMKSVAVRESRMTTR
jgi:hypothetical protein